MRRRARPRHTPKKVAVVFGTRPEAIKLAPVIRELQRRTEIDCRICLTGQHREMVDDLLAELGIAPHHDLDLMRPDQTLADLTARSLIALDSYLAAERPDVVLVQGDTTTAFTAALAAYYQRIEVGHVEAGLRTHDKYAPFPEEINRSLVAPIADYHFVPTKTARSRLESEGIDPSSIHLTGNTIIDALLWIRELNRSRPPELPPGLEERISGRRMILVTAHRRESFGPRLDEMCLAMRDLARDHPDTVLVYSVHLNPNVQAPVGKILRDVDRVILLEPQPYRQFAWLMDRCYVVLTDSGGVQEEAPALGKPVLVMRDKTERPEGVDAGNARLVGSARDEIRQAVAILLDDDAAYDRMARARNPYGDGRASARISDILCGESPEPYRV